MGKLQFASIFVLLSLVACASSKQKDTQGTEIILPTSGTVIESSGARVDLKPNQKYRLQTGFAQVQSAGHIPLLIIEKPTEQKLVSVQLQPMSAMTDVEYLPAMDRTFLEIMNEIYKIQVDLGAGQSESALARVRTLQAKYPSLSYLKLLEFSALVLNQKASEAVAVLAELKARYPEHEEVRKAEAWLRGGNK